MTYDRCDEGLLDHGLSSLANKFGPEHMVVDLRVSEELVKDIILVLPHNVDVILGVDINSWSITHLGALGDHRIIDESDLLIDGRTPLLGS